MATLNFRQDGVEYEYEARHPDLRTKTVQRFTYGQEPKVIAEPELTDGRTVEVHGYAEHWTKDEVVVVWSDDDIQHCSAWVPSGKVRRPAEDEWHGKSVSR
ncbi:MAG: hypothetical protein JWP57_4038 [Spirosoma sp.]|nr:hypothetical protein [Spirosoma sp.]